MAYKAHHMMLFILIKNMAVSDTFGRETLLTEEEIDRLIELEAIDKKSTLVHDRNGCKYMSHPELGGAATYMDVFNYLNTEVDKVRDAAWERHKEDVKR